jgi:membrane protease YdiL (CAAX protease family)
MKSISLGLLLALFFIPALLIFIAFYLGIPALQSLGLSPFAAFLIANLVPMLLLFIAAFVALGREGFTWSQLGQHYRYPRLTWKAMFWGIALFVLLNLAYGFMAVVSKILIEQGLLYIPAQLPAFVDPRLSLTPALLDEMAGGTIQGNWFILILYFVMLFFNITGEELWWSGYILPRQELSQGRLAWLIHGLLWTLFHAFKWWDLLNLLPVCLLISYAAQRTKNNWIPYIAHYLFNGLGFLVVLLAVLGLI